MPSKATNGASKPQPSDVSDQIAVLQKDIAELSATISALAKQGAQDSAEAAGEKLEEAAEKAQSVAKDGAIAAQQAHARAEDQVRANPTAALGIAAGLGFLVGFLGARKA